MNCACSRRGALLLLLVMSLVLALPAPAAPQARGTGWAELSGVEAGSHVIVVLDDGRRLERYFAGTTSDALLTVDLTKIVSRDRRDGVLALVRANPERCSVPFWVEQNGERIQVAQSFKRGSILKVARPKPYAFNPPPAVSWLLAMAKYSGPCPNCDATQTAFTGKTPLPSPLPRRELPDPLFGETLYVSPEATALSPFDTLTWQQLRLSLPPSLQGAPAVRK